MNTDAMRKEIRHRREARGWSQRQLAQRAGLSKATVQNIEAGRHAPRLQSLMKLAYVLNEDGGAGLVFFY
jgi:transcriptional regulator with XRE-family HTH domain